MLATINSFSHIRKQKLYEQEVNNILYQIIREESLPYFSISYCLLSKGKENLKIYLTFFPESKQQELLELINKKYSFLIKRKLAQSKKFAHIPNLHFLVANNFWKKIKY